MKRYVVLILSIIFINCGLDPFKLTIMYSITGTAEFVSITYATEDGGTEQIGKTSLPWSNSFKMQPADFAYLSAQNLGESGTVTVTISKNGRKLKSSTSSGPYVIATASSDLE